MSDPPPGFDARIGLCSVCVHARAVTSGNGSTFLLCEAAKDDPTLRKYPPLPVRACHGYHRAAGNH